MRRRSWIVLASTAFVLGMPSAVLAKAAVVPPFVGKTGVDSLQVLNITSLVASEVDFSMSFEQVHQLEAMPKGMNVACLASSSCLSGVAKASSANVVIAGSVAKVGEEFEIFMVNYETGRGIVRKKSWRISSDPTTMADRMSSLVNEILTGKSHEQAAKEDDLSGLTDLGSTDLFDEEDDFSFDEEDLQVGRRVATPELSDHDLDDFEMLDAESEGREAELSAARAREAEEARLREEEARRRQEEAEARQRAEELRRQQEADARRRAEEDRRRREAEEARRRQEEEEAARRADAARRAREEEEADRRHADEERRRREEAQRASAAPAEEEDDFELTFAPVSAEDMGLDFAPVDNLITVEPSSDDFDSSSDYDYSGDNSYVADASDNFDEFDDFDDFDSGYDSGRDSYDNLDDDELDSSSVRDRERERRDQEREEREQADRDRREQEARARAAAERSRYDDDLDGGRSYEGPRKDNVIKSSYNDRRRVAVIARVGTSGYQDLQFLTYGGELAFAVGDAARIHTGLEAFSVKRQFDADQCEIDPDIEGQVMGCTRWNTILPFHVGARYQRSDIMVRPYFGGDVTLTPYTEDFKFAVGFRGRGGVDFVPTEVFGLNLNVGVGLLHGNEFESIQRGLSNTGLLWQVSAGTVFML